MPTGLTLPILLKLYLQYLKQCTKIFLNSWDRKFEASLYPDQWGSGGTPLNPALAAVTRGGLASQPSGFGGEKG